MADEQEPAAEKQDGLGQEGVNRSVPTEEIIGWILRVGVTASAICIMLGVILLLFVHETGYSQSLNNLTGLTQYDPGVAGRFPTTPGEVISGLAEFKPYALIALGLLVLILTPVLRVAASIVIFLLERDYAYVLITAVVLLILVVSFLLGRAG